ncbi:hypothetical protein ACFL2T_01170 [Elusimicrobiota bacterium]
MDEIERCPQCGHNLARKPPPSPPDLMVPPPSESDEKMFDKMLTVLHLLVDKELRMASLMRLSTKTFRELLKTHSLTEAEFFDVLQCDIIDRPHQYPDELRYQLEGTLGGLGYDKQMKAFNWPPADTGMASAGGTAQDQDRG